MQMRRHTIYWFGGWLFDFTKIITILIFLGLISHYFVYTVLVVKGESMEPNYWDTDVVAVDRIHYRFHKPMRGDVIALYFPGEVEKKFIKRIIGLPNETVQIKGGKIYINKKLLKEKYLPGVITRPDMIVTLKNDEYLVFGDNRDLSSDSRIWGPLPQDYILGLVGHRFGNINNWKRHALQFFSNLQRGRVAD